MKKIEAANSPPPFEATVGTGGPAVLRPPWVAFTLFACANFLDYYNRVLVSVSAVQIKAEFQLTDAQYGMLSGLAFVVLYAAFGVIVGRLADRWPRHLVAAAILIVWSGATVLGGAATSFIGLLLAMATLGMGEAGFLPTAYSFLSDKFPPQQRALVFAWLNCAGLVGILGSFAVGGWIAAHYGWRTAFTAAGIPGFFLAFLIVFLTSDNRSVAASAETSSLRLKEALHYLCHNRAYVWLVLGAGTSAFASSGIIQWLPMFFARSHNLSLSQIGFFFGPLLTAGMILGAISGGYLSNRLARTSLWRPIWICVWANALVTPITWATLMVPSTSVALALTFFGGFLGLAHASSYVAAIQNCCQPRVRAFAVGLVVVASSTIGLGILPLAVGILSDAGADTFGENSLRYALSFVITASLGAALMFWNSHRILEFKPDQPVENVC